MTRALVVALALAGSAAQAQQHPLAGTWQISFTAGWNIDNGVETPIIGTGTLTVAAEGDSLVGTLVTDSLPGHPVRPPARLAGRAADGAVTLVAHSTATINVNGMERKAAVVSTWILTPNGDALEGTVERSIEGMTEMSPRPSPVRGTRRTG